jgi:hypothetical protein
MRLSPIVGLGSDEVRRDTDKGWVLLETGHSRLQVMRKPDIVRVKKTNELALCDLYPSVSRSWSPRAMGISQEFPRATKAAKHVEDAG